MEKIKIKLKECCLDCEYFDASGVRGLGPYYMGNGAIVAGFTEDERVIACGHMAVCAIYNQADEQHAVWVGTNYDEYTDGAPIYDEWECSSCGHKHYGEADTLTDYCPDCGAKMGV